MSQSITFHSQISRPLGNYHAITNPSTIPFGFRTRGVENRTGDGGVVGFILS